MASLDGSAAGLHCAHKSDALGALSFKRQLPRQAVSIRDCELGVQLVTDPSGQMEWVNSEWQAARSPGSIRMEFEFAWLAQFEDGEWTIVRGSHQQLDSGAEVLKSTAQLRRRLPVRNSRMTTTSSMPPRPMPPVL